MRRLAAPLVALLSAFVARAEEVSYFPVPSGAGPHDVSPAPDGSVWYTAQRQGALGRLDPSTGKMQVWDAPRGAGPYGITTTPDGAVFYASLAGNHIARIETETGEATVIDPPTRGQGARRVWSDSKGRVWVSEWNSGQVSVHDPSSGTWRSWRLPGEKPRAYSVYVDERDQIWLSDFGANAIVRFDPASGRFASFPSDRKSANVRQLLGREGEVWGAESGSDRLVRVRHGRPRQGEDPREKAS